MKISMQVILHGRREDSLRERELKKGASVRGRCANSPGAGVQICVGPDLYAKIGGKGLKGGRWGHEKEVQRTVVR